MSMINETERIRQAAYDDGYEDGIQAAAERAASACPSWCVNPSPCDGDHAGDLLTVGATAASPTGPSEPSTSGVTYPGVTVRGAKDADAPLRVCLHIGSLESSTDVEVSLHPNEAKQLIENLQLILGQITETPEAGR